MIQKAKIKGVNIAYLIANPAADEIYAAHRTGATVKELAKAEGATAAVNANFADNGPGVPIGRLIVGGKTIIADSFKTAMREELYMLPDGTLHIGKAPAGVLWALQGSPRIRAGGKNVIALSIKRDVLDSSVWAGKAYRVAYGLNKARQLVIVKTLDKVEIDDLDPIFAALGCDDALNFDGGGSAYLWPADSGWGRKMGAALIIKEGQRDMHLTIKQDFIPVGRKNRPANPMKPEYVTIHLTGNKAATATANNHVSYLKSDSAANAPASWHFTVDDGSTIYQHLPTSENGWHAGDGSNGPGNRKSIGIEVCEYDGINQNKSWANAAWLTAKQLMEHNLPLSAVVQHNKWSGKDCPKDLRAAGKWQWFLDLVAAEIKSLDPLPQEKPIAGTGRFTDVPDNHWARKSVEKAAAAGIINGVSDGVFGLGQPVTREQLAVIFDRLGMLDRKEVK